MNLRSQLRGRGGLSRVTTLGMVIGSWVVTAVGVLVVTLYWAKPGASTIECLYVNVFDRPMSYLCVVIFLVMTLVTTAVYAGVVGVVMKRGMGKKHYQARRGHCVQNIGSVLDTRVPETPDLCQGSIRYMALENTGSNRIAWGDQGRGFKATGRVQKAPMKTERFHNKVGIAVGNHWGQTDPKGDKGTVMKSWKVWGRIVGMNWQNQTTAAESGKSFTSKNGMLSSQKTIKTKARNFLKTFTRGQQSVGRRHIRLTKMLALVVGLYVALYVPHVVLVLVTDRGDLVGLVQAAVLISDINFWINPLIYAWKSKDFRKAFKKILGTRFGKVTNGVSNTKTTATGVSVVSKGHVLSRRFTCKQEGVQNTPPYLSNSMTHRQPRKHSIVNFETLRIPEVM